MEPTGDKTFDENLAELETLVRRLDSGEMPLEEALSAFEQGVGLVRQLHAVLNQAEQRVEVLTRDRDGSLRLDPRTDEKGHRVNLEKYFELRRRMIDEALDRYFPADQHQPANLHRAVRYSLLNGGKRIRPLLTLAAAEAVGGRPTVVLPFACALEMIHTYSLIHDDLPAMDDDRLRRGQPTSHIVFGEGTAILAGDALLTDAFRLMTEAQNLKGLSQKRVFQVIHGVAEAAGVRGMVAGQVADLESEGREADLALVDFIHVRKTGALILAAVRTGAILAEATPSALRSLSRYGEYLGLCFQIVDDVLDADGETAETGKESGGDERRKKATYTAVLGVPAARQRAVELREDALAALQRFGKRAEPLREIARSVVARM